MIQGTNNVLVALDPDAHKKIDELINSIKILTERVEGLENKPVDAIGQKMGPGNPVIKELLKFDDDEIVDHIKEITSLNMPGNVLPTSPRGD